MEAVNIPLKNGLPGNQAASNHCMSLTSTGGCRGRSGLGVLLCVIIFEHIDAQRQLPLPLSVDLVEARELRRTRT